MVTIADRVLRITWALWLGGLIALFIFVQVLFARDRSIAVEAAPMMFHTFERYQLVLAAAGLISAAGLYASSRSAAVAVFFVLVALACVGAVISPVLITSKMESLVAQGLRGGSEFKRLHGQSMMIYAGDAILLLIAGLLLPGVKRRVHSYNRVDEPAAQARFQKP